MPLQLYRDDQWRSTHQIGRADPENGEPVVDLVYDLASQQGMESLPFVPLCEKGSCRSPFKELYPRFAHEKDDHPGTADPSISGSF